MTLLTISADLFIECSKACPKLERSVNVRFIAYCRVGCVSRVLSTHQLSVVLWHLVLCTVTPCALCIQCAPHKVDHPATLVVVGAKKNSEHFIQRKVSIFTLPRNPRFCTGTSYCTGFAATSRLP